MLAPVRCFSCGKVIGHLWETYTARVAGGEEPAAVAADLGLRRYCCRRTLASSRNYIDAVIKYTR